MSSAAMRNLRTLARSVPRSSKSFSTTVAVPRSVQSAALLRKQSPSLARAFSVSHRRLGEGSTDVLLSQKLQEELQYEKEAAQEEESTPAFLRSFNAKGVWVVEDVSGNDEVTLRRKFGNENIRLMFSIADMQAEEEHEGEFGEEAESENEPSEQNTAYPIRASLSITKTNGPGALNVDMVCQEGNFIVENISFYVDGQLGTDLTADADWKRRGLYIGPQFETLDVAVQEEFEKFLQERGVDEGVATFIPEYIEYKEQKEYVQWLENVKKFVEL